MNKTIKTLVLAAVCCLSASAQEKLFQSANVQSPVINNDGTVTFNLFAPKAVKVEVTGDFLPTQQIDTACGATPPTNWLLRCTVIPLILMV